MTSNPHFFGPLQLHQNAESSVRKSQVCFDCNCVLCDKTFTLPKEEKCMLTHLFMDHRLVIADANLIADLKAYFDYWKLRFKDENLPHFCTTMLLDQKPDGTKSKDEKYYLLSDVLPEDKELRLNLQQKRLESIMKQHQFEREDKNYERECLFCRFASKDTRANYLKHLYDKHNFHLARPENLVFVDKLIETLSEKLDNLQCIFCEKIFKDRIILKEHMRKKGHKRINPENKIYDMFFLVNYLDVQDSSWCKKFNHNARSNIKKTSGCIQNNDHRNNSQESNEDSDPEWSEWTEDSNPIITCLFCDHDEAEFDSILLHMSTSHDFSFEESTKKYNFYHKIKIVNFIRRQVHLKQCISCELKFDDSTNLQKHLKDSKHIVLNESEWNQPEFYFPTYEDDMFLCYIQDEDESWWSVDEKDIPVNFPNQNFTNNLDSLGCKDDDGAISKEVALSVLEE